MRLAIESIITSGQTIVTRNGPYHLSTFQSELWCACGLQLLAYDVYQLLSKCSAKDTASLAPRQHVILKPPHVNSSTVQLENSKGAV